MNELSWTTLIIVAIGTYLLRAAPAIFVARRIKRSADNKSLGQIPTWITVMGPVMIAAMFGTSLIPSQPSLVSWLGTLIGTIATLAVWYKTRTLGLPVLIGVVIYGLVIALWA